MSVDNAAGATPPPISRIALIGLRFYAFILLLIGLGLAVGGAILVSKGGSLYYFAAGAAMIASAVFLWRRRRLGATIYGAMFLATVAWAIWESGFYGWALMPRIVSPAVLGAVLFIPAIRRALGGFQHSAKVALGAAAGAFVLGFLSHAIVPPPNQPDPAYQNGVTAARAPGPNIADDSGDWAHYGGTAGSERYGAAEQIGPQNVKNLKIAWTFDVGPGRRISMTPIKVGSSLYLCTEDNVIIALEAETGRQIWRHDPKVKADFPIKNCRGVAYFRTPGAAAGVACAERIISNTRDARLIAIDARTGIPCAGFGVNGETSLLTNLGEVGPGYYVPTSGPTIIRDKVIVGAFIADNQYWGEPSGVIRAYDANTGQLSWAWDMGRPDDAGLPGKDEVFTRSTPNSWAPMSGDPELGLVYVPTGIATPDYFGAQRRPFDEKYGSAVVALDVTTGKPRWHFQTTHHDLWDYDVPAPASLADVQTPGGVIKALIQPTKRGELFVLDRTTGAPVKAVTEIPVPQKGGAAEDFLSPTQPFSTGMPSLRGPKLTERDMWGITLLDQLFCRIQFRSVRYEGPNTPPGLTAALIYPGQLGGMNWAGTAVDHRRGVAITTTAYFPFVTRLLSRPEADKMGLAPMNAKTVNSTKIGFLDAQYNTPYGSKTLPFMSPLIVPCTQPPFGKISAVDLASGKLIWSKPLGVARDLGPLGMRSGFPFTLGTFNSGGPIATGSGLVFVGATQDRYFRAMDVATGKVLWRAELPGGGYSTPLTYVSPQSGRQFVALAVGGAVGKVGGGLSPTFIVAFALPAEKK